MSDTWSSIQAHKKQLDSLRERLQRRRKDPTQLGIEAGVAEGASTRSDSPGPAVQTPTQAESPVSHGCIQSLLLKFSAQEFIEVRQLNNNALSSSSSSTLVISVDHTKLWAMTSSSTPQPQKIGVKRKADDIIHQKRAPGSSPLHQTTSSPSSTSSISLASSSQLSGTSDWKSGSCTVGVEKKGRTNKGKTSHLDMEIESLLNQQSTKEQQSKKVSREILELLNTSSAREQSIVEKFRSRGRAQVQEFCDHGTKEECMGYGDTPQPCNKLHFRRIINKHTDESLGDCSFLNTCFHMDTCKYVHYEIDSPPEAESGAMGPQLGTTELSLPAQDGESNVGTLFPAQWICCDIRYLDVSILGKFAVVMADPPWDIHMELPYGTLTDDEMRKLNIPVLQDDGFLFLWVTGRAMELGRECLSLWGYECVDEIIWVKTNQLQRIIRTGRTGHWLNHGKEHCLVGVKGNPQGFNRGLDCDVIVAEVRSTSHKPDEIYGMIERLSPGTRKIELFGRPHNVQPNWVTLGNQLDGIHLLDPDVVARFKKRYPDGVISKPKNM
ncbi:N6-adenosine-methyltransferase subunit METTL3 isoform X2 [Trichomycterus rosablanca]|uniref:N6-adenosine-methyltransferase subunit METTL3 isoform X2 n=1 Tax=Trichomycterus rosablanca TaxID=2290929 RepID=UPI002F358700